MPFYFPLLTKLCRVTNRLSFVWLSADVICWQPKSVRSKCHSLEEHRTLSKLPRYLTFLLDTSPHTCVSSKYFTRNVTKRERYLHCSPMFPSSISARSSSLKVAAKAASCSESNLLLASCALYLEFCVGICPWNSLLIGNQSYLALFSTSPRICQASCIVIDFEYWWLQGKNIIRNYRHLHTYEGITLLSACLVRMVLQQQFLIGAFQFPGHVFL